MAPKTIDHRRNQVHEDDIDLENPQDHEKLFLQDRGLLQGETVPVVFTMPDGTVVSNDPGALRTNILDEGELNRLIEARAQELASEQVATMLAAQQAQLATAGEDTGHSGLEPRGGTPVPGVEENDEEADYDSWTTDELRTELAGRGLSVSGRKDDLVERLEQHDAEQADSEDDGENEGG